MILNVEAQKLQLNDLRKRNQYQQSSYFYNLHTQSDVLNTANKCGCIVEFWWIIHTIETINDALKTLYKFPYIGCFYLNLPSTPHIVYVLSGIHAKCSFRSTENSRVSATSFKTQTRTELNMYCYNYKTYIIISRRELTTHRILCIH